nr:MAG TPA: hypothetical protein [Caudoviricetes sp.]
MYFLLLLLKIRTANKYFYSPIKLGMTAVIISNTLEVKVLTIEMSVPS